MPLPYYYMKENALVPRDVKQTPYVYHTFAPFLVCILLLGNCNDSATWVVLKTSNVFLSLCNAVLRALHTL